MSVTVWMYARKVDELRLELAEYWCLCKWCQLFGTDNDGFQHWLSELRVCIDNLKFIDINKVADKRRTITTMLVNDYDYNNPDMIERIIRGKFKNEGIEDAEQVRMVSSEFASSIAGLISVISVDSVDTYDYINTTFE